MSTISTLKDRVSGPVRFVRMVNSELWYICQDNFEFSIPIEDTAGAEFKAEDKGLYFMRWITKHMKMLEAAQSEFATQLKKLEDKRLD